MIAYDDLKDITSATTYEGAFAKLAALGITSSHPNFSKIWLEIQKIAKAFYKLNTLIGGAGSASPPRRASGESPAIPCRAPSCPARARPTSPAGPQGHRRAQSPDARRRGQDRYVGP